MINCVKLKMYNDVLKTNAFMQPYKIVHLVPLKHKMGNLLVMFFCYGKYTLNIKAVFIVFGKTAVFNFLSYPSVVKILLLYTVILNITVCRHEVIIFHYFRSTNLS